MYRLLEINSNMMANLKVLFVNMNLCLLFIAIIFRIMNKYK